MEYFKYLSPDRIDVLENLKIRYTQAHALNDPFESFPGIIQKNKEWYRKTFLKIISDEADEHNFRNDVKRKQYIRARKKDFENFYHCYTDEKWLFEQAQSIVLMDSIVQGYLSLSATNRNTLMWSHYAQNHEGYVIGFDSSHEYFDYGVCKVIYSETRSYLDPTCTGQDASVFYTKSNDWKYEQEYRKSMGFVEPIALENGHSLLPFPDKLPSPTDEVLTEVKLFEFPKECVTSVVLGWRSSEELKGCVVDSIASNGMTDVNIYKAIPHKTKYEMVVERI